MLTYQQPYNELGGDYFDQRKKETKVNSLVQRLCQHPTPTCRRLTSLFSE
jgi:hypothetical protein